MTEEFHFLDSKVLNYLKFRKLTTLAYAQLETLLRPYKVEDYILTSRILYEPQPGIFRIIPPLEREILSSQSSSHDEPQNSQTFGKGKEVFGADRGAFGEGKYKRGTVFSEAKNPTAGGKAYSRDRIK